MDTIVISTAIPAQSRDSIEPETTRGEFTIIQKTKENEESRIIIENVAACIGEVSDMLTGILKESDELPHSLLHGFSWQSLRDIKTSMYLAISGECRQANVLRRGALEVAGYGVYFETNTEIDDEFKSWVSREDKEWPHINEVKEALAEMDIEESERFAEEFVERRRKLHKYVHTFYGGDVEKVRFGDERLY